MKEVLRSLVLIFHPEVRVLRSAAREKKQQWSAVVVVVVTKTIIITNEKMNEL